MSLSKSVPALLLSLLLSPFSGALLQPLAAQDLPVTKVSLFSSGVGYFEHRGTVKGDVTVPLPFSTAEVDDALKSLVVWNPGADAASSSPSVSYPSLEALDEALRGLRIDLTGNPKVVDLLARMRGAELAIDAPLSVTGRLVSVEDRRTGPDGSPRTTLVLLTASGLRAVALDEIPSFRFTDPGIAEDFGRALALVLGARDADRRVLEVRLPGGASREVALGYIVAAPVWKASYRLDLSGDKPWFQGWAIVDNPSQQDWKDITLTLVSGRPVSFVQNLYAPLRLSRPVLPLSIAGIAEARTYDSGFSGGYAQEDAPSAAPSAAMGAFAPAPPSMMKSASAPRAEPRALAQSQVETAATRAAGDQFEFTIKRPVTLERRRSAMLPLVAGALAAEKFSVWTADSGSKNPLLGVRVTNTLGIKLPAGPITVFDGGSYAGDALVEFLPEKDKRILVYGQDLSVTVLDSRSNATETIGVSIAKGVLVYSRRTTYTRAYELRNASATARKVLIEHPLSNGTDLVAPSSFDERTDSLYRFLVAVPAAGQAKLEVKERSTSQERVSLGGFSSDSFLSYASSTDLPGAVKDALKKGAELRRKLDEARRVFSDLGTRRNEVTADQDRLRRNLDAVGRDSVQGQTYLKRLLDSETELDSLAAKISDAKKSQQDAQSAFDDYIAKLQVN